MATINSPVLIHCSHDQGDEFALRDGGALYCKEDHDVLEKSAQAANLNSIEHNNNNALLSNNNNNNSNTLNSNSTTLSNSNNHSSELGSLSGKYFYQPQYYFCIDRTPAMSKMGVNFLKKIFPL